MLPLPKDGEQGDAENERKWANFNHDALLKVRDLYPDVDAMMRQIGDALGYHPDYMEKQYIKEWREFEDEHAEDIGRIKEHQGWGHTYHCACRLVWGDGECECNKKKENADGRETDEGTEGSHIRGVCGDNGDNDVSHLSDDKSDCATEVTLSDAPESDDASPEMEFEIGDIIKIVNSDEYHEVSGVIHDDESVFYYNEEGEQEVPFSVVVWNDQIDALKEELKCQKFLNDVLKQGSSDLFKKVLHREDMLRLAIWIIDNNDPWSFNGWRMKVEAILKEADVGK
jgi:hypothetical protein